MSVDLHMVRGPGQSLIPADMQSSELLAAWPRTAPVRLKATRERNAKFHRKAFALLGLAFDYWEPDTTAKNGIQPSKSFERFRKDVLILAGHREAVVNVKGDVRYEAKSISFANCDEDSFAQLYKSIFDVCWRIVLKAHFDTEEDANNAVEQLLAFE